MLSPNENPFFAVLWRQQRRNMRQAFMHWGVALGAMWLAFALALAISVNRAVPLHRVGPILFEVVAWVHFIIASIYGTHLWRRARHFVRQEVLPQLLLTGVPPLWMTLALPIFPLFMQVYLAVLCLPFYAAAIAFGGGSWLAACLSLAVIVCLGLLGAGGWWVSLQFVFRIAGFTVWANLPQWLLQPVTVYAWAIPAGALVAVGLPLVMAVIAAEWAWALEPRLYPAQAKVRAWADWLWAVAFLFVWGFVWAHGLPSEFEAKVAFTLCALWMLRSLTIWFAAQTKRGENPYFPTRSAKGSVRDAFLTGVVVLGVGALTGWASKVPVSTLVRTSAIAVTLNLVHAVAFGLSFAWWQKFLSAKKLSALWLLAFLVWCAAPFGAIFMPSLSPLFGVHGYLVPLTLLPPAAVQRLTGNFLSAPPAWWATATVQLLWSAWLWWLERRAPLTPPARDDTQPRDVLSETHPLWGWLVRWEGQLCERLANPLVTLQLRWQRRFKALAGTMETGVVLLLLVAFSIAAAIVYPEPALVKFVNGMVARLPSLAGLAALFVASIALGVLDQKVALWQLGHKRILEQFVLAPLTPQQWQFGFWFPRFWLSVKAMLPYAVGVWFGVLLLPTLDRFLLALLITATLPVAVLAISLSGLVSSLISVVESYALGCLFLPIVVGIASITMPIALFTARVQVHAILWAAIGGASVLGLFLEWMLLARLKALRTPDGYDRWLQLAGQRARRVQRT